MDKNFRQDIQGLRAIAVLAVMLFHYDSSWLSGGFLGVDLFFVISGFLITTIIQRDIYQSPKVSFLIGFYLKRINRILPAYLFVLIVTTTIAAVIFTSRDFGFFIESLKSALSFTSNQYFLDFSDYFLPNVDEYPLLHTWSLSVEMQFYLFYPLLFFIVPKKHLTRVFLMLAIIMTLIATFYLSIGIKNPTYYGLYARVPEFLIGALASQLSGSAFFERHANSFAAIGCTLIVAPLFVFSGETNIPGLMACFPVLGGAIILVNPFSLMSRFLSFPLLTWIGNISYSLYLWHWIVLVFLRYVSDEHLLSTIDTFIYWVVSFLLACISHYSVEEIFRRKMKYNLLLLSILIASSIGALQWSARLNQSLFPLPIEYTRYAEPDSICDGKIVGNCLRGDLSSLQPPILVLGDSHAGMLNHFFDKIGQELHMSFRVITAHNCLTILSFQSPKFGSIQEKECQLQREEAAKYVYSADKIIIAGFWKNYQYANFLPQMQQWIEKYEQKEIFLLADVPTLSGINPKRMYRFQHLGMTYSQADIMHGNANENEKHNQIIKSLANKYDSVTYMNLLATGFFDDAYFEDKYPKYMDYHHLNEVAAKLYATFSIDVFKQYLEKKHKTCQ